MLTREQVLEHCLSLPGAWPDQPWEGDVVAKVGDKIFAFVGDGSVGVKAGRSREEADELLEAVDASYADVVARLPRSKRPSG